MGNPTGFMEIERQDRVYVPVEERIRDFREFYVPLADDELSSQGARCMDCGIPYCHEGCPVNNIIPDWNDLVYRNKWRQALDVLHATNNFPEFTGRICPAPCEAACTLNLIEEPVTIKTIECAIVDRGWEEGWIRPQIASRKTDKRVAVVGSGPAGLACAQQLARAGHGVVVFEKHDRIGGLLCYGIPDFKMEKYLIDRRMAQMQAEGVEFRPNSHVGVNITVERLMERFDAVALTGGAEAPRELEVPGRDLEGVHFAMDFLIQQNRRVAGEFIPESQAIRADGKHVIVIGGGDTGSDCVGTSTRQGAASVTQYEILEKPPLMEDKDLTWPDWPLKLRTSSSQEEGCKRDWSIVTKSLSGPGGRVDTLHGVRVEWETGADGRPALTEIAGAEFQADAGLLLLAMGFVHPTHDALIEGLDLDGRGNVKADTETYRTSVYNMFAAGDMRRGQSLVVWAIREGRQCARAIDEHLMGISDLPR